MKVKIFSVSKDEEASIKAYQEAHPEVEFISVAEDFSPAAVENLEDDIDGICIEPLGAISEDDKIYQELVDKGIKQISTRTAGYDDIDVVAAKKAGLIVTNVPAYSPRSVAEFALMQIFRLLRHTPQFDANTAKQDFRWLSELQSREIHSVTVGIIGAGRIGETLARLLQGLGAKVLAYDVKPRVEVSYVAEYVSLDELLAQSDVISLHVDLNPTTIGLISEAEFKKMKPGMLLVNASRGQAVDTEALFKALDEGIVAAAAIDTLAGEGAYASLDKSGQEITDPIFAEVLRRPEILYTPHVAFFTNIAVENMVQIALDDVLSILKTGHGEHEI